MLRVRRRTRRIPWPCGGTELCDTGSCVAPRCRPPCGCDVVGAGPRCFLPCWTSGGSCGHVLVVNAVVTLVGEEVALLGGCILALCGSQARLLSGAVQHRLSGAGSC